MPDMRKGRRSGAHGCHNRLRRRKRTRDHCSVSRRGTASGKGAASGGSLNRLEDQSARDENAYNAGRNSTPHRTHSYLGCHGRT